MFKLEWGRFIQSLILVNAGVLFLAYNYGLMPFSFNLSRDWPFVIIAFGILGVLKSVFVGCRNKKTVLAENRESVEKILKDAKNRVELVDEVVAGLSGQKRN